MVLAQQRHVGAVVAAREPVEVDDGHRRPDRRREQVAGDDPAGPREQRAALEEAEHGQPENVDGGQDPRQCFT